MFGLFKRIKIKDWEIELLKLVLSEINEKELLEQVNNNLLKGVLTNVSDIPGYVAFTYNPEVLKRYDNLEAHNYRITNIKVFDKKGTAYNYTIYVSTGTINGYAIVPPKKGVSLNLDRTDTNNVKIIKSDNEDFKELSKFLNANEKELINPSEVYKVSLSNKEYYNILNLEDGDFIAVDKEKNIYKITHDPYEILLLNETTLKDVFTKKLFI
ncbi:hypothetical protein [Flavivirga sp. 57AJ16]|uniref:hypothetical protein n=1 Tax=Flavivirga sp. 57AJ16 TaxID=3025307 RepID=UPI0023661FA3|nr:hypothetical protein [Flavivirga sp. 57AJ16]MDD7886038.1 hypothetical protein [Flavivirga sp. 57AJ16]